MEATVHWHGLRLENRYDGTHETQQPMAVGEKFSARVTFPDPGLYWYHPHIREDYGQEMGLYGNVPGRARRPRLLAAGPPRAAADARRHPARGRQGRAVQPHRDDLRGDGPLRRRAAGRAARPTSRSTRAARRGRPPLPDEHRQHPGLQGRAAGRADEARRRRQRPRRARAVRRGRHPRALGAGGGRRAVRPGRRADARAPHARARLPAGRDHGQRGAGRAVARRSSSRSCAPTPTWSPSASGSRRTWRPSPTRRSPSSPRWTWARRRATGPVVYACPMHPEVVSEEPGHCPECGMKLLAVEAPRRLHLPDAPRGRQRAPATARVRHEAAAGAARRRGRDATSTSSTTTARRPRATRRDADGIEWEDDMVEVNRMTTPANMRWKLIDRETGAENAAIDWRFRVGDQVKIRLLNEMAGDHPMHHPFHVHGAGRFLVLSRDGVRRAQPGLEGHGAGAHRRDGRHPARRHQRRAVDGSLPHRRAPRERHDVQLRRLLR